MTKAEKYIVGSLILPVRINQPAIILTNGKSIKTSKVIRIIAAKSDYVEFETQNSIYCVCPYSPVVSQYAKCA